MHFGRSSEAKLDRLGAEGRPRLRPFQSLRARLLALIALCLLPSAAVFAVAAFDAHRQDIDGAQVRAMQMARLIDGQNDRLFAGVASLMRVVGLSGQIAEGRGDDCAAYLSKVGRATPAIINLVKVNRDGMYVCSGRPLAAGAAPPTYIHELFFQQAVASKAFALSGFRLGSVTGLPQVTAVLPILDDRGDIKFFIHAGLSLDWLSAQFDSLSLEPGATMTIIDADGIVLARHPDPDALIGKTLPHLAAIRASSGTSEGVGEATDATGTRHLYGFSNIGGNATGTSLILDLPEELAFATARRLEATMALAGGSAVTLLLLAGWIGANAFVLRWVRSLTDAARRFAAGEHDARALVPSGGGELATLASAFNDMSDTLVLREQDLTAANSALRHSESRFRLLAETVTDVIVLWGSDGGIRYVSPACEAMLGYRPVEMARLPTEGLIHPDDLDRFTSAYGGISPEFPTLASTFRLRPKQGQSVWVEAHFRFIDGQSSGDGGIVASIRDITDRKATEFALAHKHTMLETMLRALPDGVRVLDRDLKLIAWNDNLFSLLELDQQAILAAPDPMQALLRAFAERGEYGPGEVDAIIAERRQLIGQPVVRRYDRRLASGRWVDYSVQPIPGGGSVLVCRDITDRKAHEFQLEDNRARLEEQAAALVAGSESLNAARAEAEDARERAERASQAKTAFLATMSHEIRSPMHGIIGMNDLLLHSALTEEQRGHATVVKDAAGGLLGIINDILDISKLEAGRLEIETVEFDLEPVIRQAIDLTEPKAREKGLALSRHLDPASLRRFRGDPTRLRQVLVNLLSNAIKFTEQGAIDVEIAADSVGGDAVHLRVEVRDSGVGIAAEAIGRLFTKFTQADQTIGRRFGGTGLGLAICKQLVEAMGGEIGVRSEPGRGSCFWFTLPLPLAAARLEGDDASASLASPPPSAVKQTGRGKRLLLAEDVKINQIIASRYLTDAGYGVDIANNGGEAVEAVQRRTYDIILMDIHMPSMDGLEAVRQIRQLPPPKGRIPIVALTADAIDGVREQYLAAGMDDFLSKPFDRDELLGLVERWLGDLATDDTVPDDGRAPAEPILDSRMLRELEAVMPGEDFPQFLRAWLDSTIERIATIARLARQQNLAELRGHAHNLVSTAGGVGAKHLAALARRLESACVAERGDEATALAALIGDAAPPAYDAVQQHLSLARA
jgi:PAS domain S-box-containing protein